MKSLDLLAALVDPKAPDQWYVTDGRAAVGPIGLELLGRGIEAGKVPNDAFVRHVSWNGWRGISDLIEHEPSFDPKRSFKVLPQVKLPGLKDATRESLPSIDIEDDFEVIVDATPPPPVLFDAAADLPEALLMLLAKVVEECEAECAQIHLHRLGEEGAVVVCTHGPRMFEALGDRLRAGDPVLFSAKQGNTVMAEPVSGVAGRAIKSRLSKLGARVDAAFMVPVPIDDQLLALLEVGRGQAFKAADVATAEDLVDELLEAALRMSWTRDWKAPTAAPARAQKKPPPRVVPDVKAPKKPPPKPSKRGN